MRWFRLLLALTVALPCIQAKAQPKDPSEQPAQVPEDPPLIPGKVKLTLNPNGHIGVINRLLFTPDGKHLISAGSDNTIRVWDGHTGQHLRVLRTPAGVGPIALSPDGRTLAVGFAYREEGKVAQVIALMALADGRIERLLRGHSSGVAALDFSADGKRLASSSWDKTLRIWDLNGKDESEQVINTGKAVYGLSFSPEGTRLVEARDDGSDAIRDLVGGKVVPLKAAKALFWWGPTTVAWSPDGKTIATGSEEGVWLFEPDGKLRKHLPGRWAVSVAFSRDSRRVLATSWSEGTWRAWIVDVRSGKEERELRHNNPNRGVFSPDGALAATAGGVDSTTEIFLWRTSNGAVVRRMTVLGLFATTRLPGGTVHAGWSRDGKTVSWRKLEKPESWKGGPTSFDLSELQFGAPLASGNFRGAVLQQAPFALKQLNPTTAQVLKDGKRLVDLQLPQGFTFRPSIQTDLMTFMDKDKAALLFHHSAVWVYDVQTGKQLPALGHGSSPISAAPSPNGRYLLTLATDQVLRIWSVETGKVLLSMFVVGREWIAWAPGGCYAASPGGEKLMGWRVDNGIDQAPSFHPAQRFRKHFYRPDVIKLVLEKGSIEEALQAAGGLAQDVQQLLPPRTTLSHKQDGAKIAVDAVAQAGSKSQPVSELQLLVDGRPVRLENGQVAVKNFAPPVEKDARGEWSLTLEPGLHKLSVRATARDTYSISEEVVADVPVPMAVPRNNKHGTLYYVGIGVNQFQHEPELKLTGAVPDILAMEQCLKETCKERLNEVKPTVLTDDKATLQAILKTLADLPGKLKPADVVIVHYSSHGEVEEGGLFLLCHDSKRGSMKTTAVPGEKLRDVLGQYPCPVLLILDACHSGKFPLLRPPTDPLSRMLADDSCGVAVMTAALAHQKAIDTEKGGVFTQALVEGLSGKADPDKISKRLYVHHLFTYVFDSVARQTANKQMPLYLPSGSVPPIVLKEAETK